VNVQGNGVGNIASILHTEIDANTSFAVQANGAGNILGIVNSVLNASPTTAGIRILVRLSDDWKASC
jgi:hypothetical protein